MPMSSVLDQHLEKVIIVQLAISVLRYKEISFDIKLVLDLIPQQLQP